MQISRYIIPLVALFTLACTSPMDESGESGEKGSVSISMEVTRSSGETQSESTLLESGTLRIFNATGGLVRYYKDLSRDVSDFLAVGSYSAEFAVGVATPATFDSADISYTGEDTFEITSQKTSVVDMNIVMQNTMLTINFDQTLDSHYTDYSLVTYAANTIESVDAETTPMLTYDESGDGYLILPEGVDNIVWQFMDNGLSIATGEIKGAQRAHQYKLTIKHSDHLDVSGMTITLDGTEDYENIFGFKPQPVIKGYEFDIEEIQDYAGNDYVMSVNTLFEIAEVSAKIGDDSYVWGVNSEVTYDSATKKITLSKSLFDGISVSQGGVNNVTVEAVDANGSEGFVDLKVGINGLSGVENENFWSRTATMKWYVTGDEPSQVLMRYRKSGDTEWGESYTATSLGNGEWGATSVAGWSEKMTLNDLDVWQPTTGYAPSTDYEFQVIVDGVESEIAYHTSATATQSLPTLNDSGLSCYTEGNTNAPFWSSGNNNMAVSPLCSYSSAFGGAYLDGTEAGLIGINKFAAGNVFVGTFNFGGKSGTASFGQKYEWNILPKAIQLDYKATVGSGDKGLIYFAIVDWGSQHNVTSGMGDPSGVWNPSTQKKTDEGEIIGYALTNITASVSAESVLTIPIYYYNKTAAKPNGASRYTIVINATTSYRGEYLEGSKDSELYVKNFRFVY